MFDDKLNNMPLYLKGLEILKMVNRIAELIPEENEFLTNTGEFMRADALIIPSKIASAEATDWYDSKMENAAIIRKSALDIHNACNEFLIKNFKDGEYLKVLRHTVEEFRILFAEWVKGFDYRKYVIDRWGLFNPPGINYDDPDPNGDTF